MTEVKRLNWIEVGMWDDKLERLYRINKILEGE